MSEIWLGHLHITIEQLSKENAALKQEAARLTEELRQESHGAHLLELELQRRDRECPKCKKMKEADGKCGTLTESETESVRSAIVKAQTDMDEWKRKTKPDYREANRPIEQRKEADGVQGD